MELPFMVVAILLLTVIASYAIRRAEEEAIERHDGDRQTRNAPAEKGSRETASGTKAAT